MSPEEIREGKGRGAYLQGADLRYEDLRGADLRDARRGQIASDLVCRLARLGACAQATCWAWDLHPDCSLRSAWECACPDFRYWLGSSYKEAVARLYSV